MNAFVLFLSNKLRNRRTLLLFARHMLRHIPAHFLGYVIFNFAVGCRFHWLMNTGEDLNWPFNQNIGFFLNSIPNIGIIHRLHFYTLTVWPDTIIWGPEALKSGRLLLLVLTTSQRWLGEPKQEGRSVLVWCWMFFLPWIKIIEFFIIKQKVILDSSHIGLDCTGQCCTQIWTRIHLLQVNIQRETCERARPAGGRIPAPDPDPETRHLRLTEAAGVPTLRCQKSYPRRWYKYKYCRPFLVALVVLVLLQAASAGSGLTVCRCGSDYTITAVLVLQHDGTICILTFKWVILCRKNISSVHWLLYL